MQIPNHCIVSGGSKAKDPSISLYWLPKQPELRKKWLNDLHLTDSKVNSDSRVCSRHFRDSNPKTIRSLHIGARFSEPPLMGTARGKRRATRELQLTMKDQHLNRPCIRTSTCSSVSGKNVLSPTLSSHASPPSTHLPPSSPSAPSSSPPLSPTLQSLMHVYVHVYKI